MAGLQRQLYQQDMGTATVNGKKDKRGDPSGSKTPTGVIMKNLYSVFVEFYGKGLFFVFLFIPSVYGYIIIGKYEQIMNGK